MYLISSEEAGGALQLLPSSDSTPSPYSLSLTPWQEAPGAAICAAFTRDGKSPPSPPLHSLPLNYPSPPPVLPSPHPAQFISSPHLSDPKQISPTNRPHLARTSPTSLSHLTHTPPLPRPHLAQISPISRRLELGRGLLRPRRSSLCHERSPLRHLARWQTRRGDWRLPAVSPIALCPRHTVTFYFARFRQAVPGGKCFGPRRG